MAEMSLMCLPEVLEGVLMSLEHKELRAVRLVSGRWNEAGAEALRRFHGPATVTRWSDLLTGYKIMQNRFQGLPFSKLCFENFDNIAVGHAHNSLLTAFGPEMSEVSFVESRMVRIIGFGNLRHEMISVVLNRTVNIRILTFDMDPHFFKRGALESPGSLPASFPNLKVLTVRSGFPEQIAAAILQRSPALEILKLASFPWDPDHIGSRNWNRRRYERWDDLAAFLAMLPASLPVKYKYRVRCDAPPESPVIRTLNRFFPNQRGYSWSTANWKHSPQSLRKGMKLQVYTPSHSTKFSILEISCGYADRWKMLPGVAEYDASVNAKLTLAEMYMNSPVGKRFKSRLSIVNGKLTFK